MLPVNISLQNPLLVRKDLWVVTVGGMEERNVTESGAYRRKAESESQSGRGKKGLIWRKYN